MEAEAETLERGVELFQSIIDGDPALRAEFEASLSGYFRGQAPEDAPTPRVRSARRRHLEWFLFDRAAPGEVVRGAERLLGRWRGEADDMLLEGLSCLLNSHASIFEVVEVERGHGARLRDLAGLGDYPVLEPDASHLVEEGDLVVGRLYPIGARHCISPGAGCFRSPELAAAVRRDLERQRKERRHPVLRVAQDELEAMFWGAPAVAVQGDRRDPVGEARLFLSESGLAEHEVEGILAELAAAAFDDAALVHGVDDPLALILERLAFETQADLDRARRVLLGAWATLGKRQPFPAQSSRARTLERVRHRAEASSERVERAIAEFDRDRAAGLDVERSFAKLERNLGLDEELDEEADEEADEDEESEDLGAVDESARPAPDFPGVVGAIVEEFLWEVETAEGAPAARELERLRVLGEFGGGIGVFENLSARDLLTFASFWLPERGELADGGDATRMLAALRRFCTWVEEAHALELLGTFGDALAGLERSLPRITEANRLLALRGDSAGREPGQLYEYLGGDGAGGARLRDRAGLVGVVRIGTALERLLTPGDQLRVRIASDGDPAMLRCYPPEAKGLLEEPVRGPRRG